MSDAAADSGLVAELRAQIKRLNKESQGRKERLREQAAELAAAKKRAGDLEGELTTLKAKPAADPDVKDRRIAELEGEIRAGKHRTAFEKAARAKGAKDDAIEALWGLSQYAPEGDEPDDAKLQGLVDGLSKRYAPAFGTAAEPPKTPQPGHGAGRGGPAKEGAGGAFEVRKSDLQSYAWMTKNGKQYAEAVKAGTAVVLDD